MTIPDEDITKWFSTIKIPQPEGKITAGITTSTSRPIPTEDDISKWFDRIKVPEGAILPGISEEERQTKWTAPLTKIFDVLQRGQYASANVARALLEGRSDIASAAWKGLTGGQKGTFMDIAKDMGLPYPEIIGTALDIGLDPTTYIPFGAPLKGIKAAAGLVAKLPGAEKVGTALKPAVDVLGRAFVPGYGLPKEYYMSKVFAKAELEAQKSKTIKLVKEFAKGTTPEERVAISFARTHPEEVGNLPGHLKAKLDVLVQKLDEIGLTYVKEGLMDMETFLQHRNTYLPGYYAGKTKLLNENIIPNFLEKQQKPFTLKHKSFRDIFEAEDYARVMNRPDLIPEKDAAKLLGLATHEQNIFLARKHFVDQTLENFGRRISAAEISKLKPMLELANEGVYLPKGALRFFPVEGYSVDAVNKIRQQVSKVTDLLSAETGELVDAAKFFDTLSSVAPDINVAAISKKVPAYVLPKSIADDLNKIQKVFIGDPATRDILKFYDQILGPWKTMATVVRLPFHLRNELSNWFNMWLGGVSPIDLPKRLEQALNVQKGTEGYIITKSGEKLLYKDLKKMFEEKGLGSGWLASDVKHHTPEELEKVIKKQSLSSTILNWAVEKARSFGAGLETNARYALAIDELIKGGNIESAWAKVGKYLFHYGERTPFEENVMRRIIPFYSWLRGNIPLQIVSILEQPGKYATVKKTLDMFDKMIMETPEEKRLKPQYMVDMMYGKTPFTATDPATGVKHPVYYYVDLPYTDLNRFLDIRNWLSWLTPAKAVAEILTNVKTFPDISPLEKPVGKMVPAPFWATWLPHATQKVLGLEPIPDPQNPGQKILGMRARVKHAIDTAFPFLSELGRLNPQPTRLSTEREPWKWLSYFTGITFEPVNLEMQRRYLAIETRGKLDDVRRLMINKGRPLTKEELDDILKSPK